MTNLIIDMASFFCLFRFKRGFARFLIWAVVVIMSLLKAVDTKFIGFGHLTLFAPHSGKCCFVDRVGPFLWMVSLLTFVSRKISFGVSVVRRCGFVLGFSCLYSIKREKKLL